MTTPNDAAVDVMTALGTSARGIAILSDVFSDQCKPKIAQDWADHLTKHDAAIAAIRELVEADREYDAAMRSEADTGGMLRREDARVRRAAALRRFATGGE